MCVPNCVREHPYITTAVVIGTGGLPLIGYLGYLAVIWIIDNVQNCCARDVQKTVSSLSYFQKEVSTLSKKHGKKTFQVYIDYTQSSEFQAKIEPLLTRLFSNKNLTLDVIHQSTSSTPCIFVENSRDRLFEDELINRVERAGLKLNQTCILLLTLGQLKNARTEEEPPSFEYTYGANSFKENDSDNIKTIERIGVFIIRKSNELERQSLDA